MDGEKGLLSQRLHAGEWDGILSDSRDQSLACGSFPHRDRMRPLALMFVLCGLVISITAAADQTCKAIAIKQRLADAALLSFVKQCEIHAQMACAAAAHKMLAEPASESFIHMCVAKAIGAGPRWCVPHHCRDNSDCTGGTGCDACWAGLCGQ